MARAGQRAGAARLLVRVRADDDVATQPAARGERLGRDDHRRDAALHVARAATDDAAVAHWGSKGPRPAVLRRAGTTSTWPFRSSERPPPAPGNRAASCGRPAKPIPPDGVSGWSGGVGGSGLPDVDLGAGAPQALREVGLQRGVLPRRRGGVATALGVEADQVAGEGDDLVAAGRRCRR